MKLGIPRSLLGKLVGSIALAFVLTMALTWAILFFQSERNAKKLMLREFADVRGEVEERINRRLISVAIEARERLQDQTDRSVASLQALAEDLRIDTLSIVNSQGVIEASNCKDYLGFDFTKAEGQAAAFLPLLTSEIEFAQEILPNTAFAQPFKYVGVWIPEGGFVQIGCTVETVRLLAQTTISGVTHNQHLGGIGEVIVTMPEGHILSAAKENFREGSMFETPGDDFYYMKEEISGFPVYLVYPKSEVAGDRHVFLGIIASLTILTLAFVAIFVALVIAGFVRAQIEKRLHADMEMAKTIQEGCLPSVFPPFPELVDKIDIFAFMRTAREVGGDFYDFFFAGPNHLALVIADVSGKGVPAAMFMMRAKTTIRGHLESDRDIGAAMMKVNDLLAEGNDSNMFVTAWVGVIDIETGMVKYVNAGHNPPLVSRNDGSVEWIKERSGLTLAAMSGIKYRVKTMKLAPGESIFLYTDGVTEATDMEEKLFGEKRLETEIASTQTDVKNRCDQVLKSIDDYQGLAPQADDITMLGFTLKTIEKAFPVIESSLGESADWMSEVFASPKPAIIVDEIVSNIVRCSGATKFTIQIRGNSEIVITDDGKPFDPTELPDPDVTLKAEDRKIGGLGLFLVKKMSKSVEYSRLNDTNILRVTLK